MGEPSYMLFPGIQGNIRSGKYKGWFEADRVQFGTARGMGVKLTEVDASLPYGAGTPKLYQAWQEGKRFPKVQVVTADQGRKSVGNLEIELTAVTIVNFSTYGERNPTAGPTISLVLYFEQFKQSIAGGPTSVGIPAFKRP